MQLSAPVLICLALTPIAWGYNWVVIKRSTELAPIIPFVSARLLLAALVLFATALLLRRSLRISHPIWVLAIGLVNTALSFLLMMWGVEVSHAGRSAILVYTMPFFVALLAWPVLGERPGRAQWLASAIALTGILLLLDPSRRPHLSDLYLLGSGLAWAAGVVMIKRYQLRCSDDPIALCAWQNLAGALALALFALPGGLGQWQWGETYLYFALVYNGAIVSGLSLVLWFWLLRRVDSGIASLSTLAAPVVGLLSSMVELGERPAPSDWAGIALVLFALSLIGLSQLRSRPRTS